MLRAHNPLGQARAYLGQRRGFLSPDTRFRVAERLETHRALDQTVCVARTRSMVSNNSFRLNGLVMYSWISVWRFHMI